SELNLKRGVRNLNRAEKKPLGRMVGINRLEVVAGKHAGEDHLDYADGKPAAGAGLADLGGQ
ncbi:MAG: hypothetical protein Q9160_009320, partial [Pyrenula sp. 1 TL-2023]